MKWIPLLFLAACASPPPSQYERGTFTRPPPAPHRPGVGAPTYDPHVQPLPPQPQPRPQRLLPQTPKTRAEAGIWAGDGDDDDVIVVDAKDLTILGVVIPIFETEEGLGDAGPAIDCAKHWNKVLTTDAAKWVHDVKDDAVQRCLVAMMHEACTILPEDAAEQMRAAGVINLGVWKYLPAMKRRAEAFTDLMCRDARTIGFYVDRFVKLVPTYKEVALRDFAERSR